MAIQQVQVVKVNILNEDGTRVMSVEYPHDMQLGEILDKVTEFGDAVKKLISDKLKAEEEEKAKKEKEDAEKEGAKKEDGKEAKVEPMPATETKK